MAGDDEYCAHSRINVGVCMNEEKFRINQLLASTVSYDQKRRVPIASADGTNRYYNFTLMEFPALDRRTSKMVRGPH